MQFQFSFKHMEVSPALKEYTQSKVHTLIKKFVNKPIEAHVTFSIDRHLHIAHCSLVAGDGFTLQVEHSCSDMYGSVDKMLDRLATQLKKKKDRLKNHKARGLKNISPQNIDVNRAEIDAGDIVAFEEARKKRYG